MPYGFSGSDVALNNIEYNTHLYHTVTTFQHLISVYFQNDTKSLITGHRASVVFNVCKTVT